MITDERLREIRAACDETPAEDRDSADNTINELLNEIERMRGGFLSQLHYMRGVGMACTACGGTGTRVYSSTSTWRGGAGGSTLTTDVCDRCWGSGDEYRHWQSWREQQDNASTLLVVINVLRELDILDGQLPPTSFSVELAMLRVKEKLKIARTSREILRRI